MLEKHQLVASCMLPNRDLACNPGMCPDWELNWRPLDSQAGAHTTEPHQSGSITKFASHPSLIIVTTLYINFWKILSQCHFIQLHSKNNLIFLPMVSHIINTRHMPLFLNAFVPLTYTFCWGRYNIGQKCAAIYFMLYN